MIKLKHENPFAMGNLSDLMFARENGDLEYLKEWTRKAVPKYEEMRDIQLTAFSNLIKLNEVTETYVEGIRAMFLEEYNSSEQTNTEED